jgi:hypothetical protein
MRSPYPSLIPPKLVQKGGIEEIPPRTPQTLELGITQNLETNQIVETCEVTFDKTQPRSQLVFECVGDDELGKVIFQEEEYEHGDDEDGGVMPTAEHVPTTSTTVMDGPSPTPTTTNQDQGEAVVEGDVASRREPPR